MDSGTEFNAAAAVEASTQELGQRFWRRLERHSPSIFEKKWWDDRILAWAMADESVKVQMFRFIDVLPTLRTRESITRHLQDTSTKSAATCRERLAWLWKCRSPIRFSVEP